jgi:hypothetical protein
MHNAKRLVPSGTGMVVPAAALTKAWNLQCGGGGGGGSCNQVPPAHHKHMACVPR